MSDKNFPDYLLGFSRIIAGMVFMYSGFVKGIDPLGSAYKFADYFVAFNLEFLEPFALALSVILSSAEMLIGLALLAGVHMVLASWLVLLFMAFFTILTFIIALTDPVSDCGCFGDALILTNWETFIKNLILSVFVVYLFINRKKYSPFFANPLMEWGTLISFTIIILGVTGYSYYNLPVIDFRPYKVGADIIEKMSIPHDAPGDEYEITLYYQKDGEIRAFSVDNLPGPDWQWVRTESTLVRKGYEPAITGFFIESVDDGNDYTYDILEDQGYTFMLIAHNLDKTSEKNTGRINRLATWSHENGVNFICLTGSPESRIRDYTERTNASYDFYFSDEITLKTIIRSNPGLLLIKEGTILGKWHHRNIPDAGELKENLLSWSVEEQQASVRQLISWSYIGAVILLIILLRLIRFWTASFEKQERKK